MNLERMASENDTFCDDTSRVRIKERAHCYKFRAWNSERQIVDQYGEREAEDITLRILGLSK